MILGIYQENDQKRLGYKLAAKGMLLQLITYLSRNYAVQILSQSANSLHLKHNAVQYVHANEPENIFLFFEFDLKTFGLEIPHHLKSFFHKAAWYSYFLP